MRPFGSILRLALGDVLAKGLNFLAFVYLARVLDVAGYGILELAIAVTMYFQLAADAGLELWATRQAAQGADVRSLTARTVPLRCLLAAGAFGVLLLLLPALPDYPALRAVTALLGLTVFSQALSLKWVFLGQEKMGRVVTGLVVPQLVFAGLALALVRGPAGILRVPVLRLASELVMSGYFLWRFAAEHGGLQLSVTLRDARHVLRAAMPMGAALALGLASYNFDAVLLGLLAGPTAVGWYTAAYKPVTMALALPVTYYVGLFPPLARAYGESHEAFRRIVVRSLRITSIFAVPLGIGGTLLAEPLIAFLFGPAYANSVPPLRVLAWSAVLVILRGTYKHALNAAAKPGLDLRCAGAATGLNIALNLLLIPPFGTLGAAVATLVAEFVWLSMAWFYFCRHVARVSLLPFLLQPVTAAAVMAACLLLTQPLFWAVRAALGVLVYFGTLAVLGEPEVKAWLRGRSDEAAV